MRILATYLLLFLFLIETYAQQFEIAGPKNNSYSSNFSAAKSTNTNFDAVDAIVRSYSSKYTTTEALANQIKKDFQTEKFKVRALYTWLCLNIRYDMVSFNRGQTEIGFSYASKADFNRKMLAINNSIVNKTMKSGKAVCEGYAQTFKQVSEKLGIPCKIIGGFAKGDVNDIDNIPDAENHAWNAVKIDSEWYLIDTTWGAGFTNGNKWTTQFDDFYFFTKPEEFSLTHYPTENEWLLTESSLTKKEFFSKPIHKKSFFTNKLKLISPKFGSIEVATHEDITFLLNKIPEHIQLFYAFKGDKYSQKINIDCNDTQCNFAIPFIKNTDSELYIFANQKPILEYYIKKK